jgi:acyl-CoA synthetase (AMP-forming)/AMP-acid ligase II
VDPGTGRDVAPGEQGELWCRGPNIMRGYLNNPAATADTVDEDGFLHTGDIVTVDPTGVFRVVDRLKELIKYKGPPGRAPSWRHCCSATKRWPTPRSSACPTPNCGEVPQAFVVRRDSHPGLDTDSVLAFVAGRVAPHKKIRLV